VDRSKQRERTFDLSVFERFACYAGWRGVGRGWVAGGRGPHLERSFNDARVVAGVGAGVGVLPGGLRPHYESACARETILTATATLSRRFPQPPKLGLVQIPGA
jgi:hypothetical protein